MDGRMDGLMEGGREGGKCHLLHVLILTCFFILPVQLMDGWMDG